MSKVLTGTWETSRTRKRNEESDETIVAGKRGNARGCEGPLRVKRGYIGFNGGGSDTLRVTHGEPYAGKRHVRFDERAGVPHGTSRSTLHTI